MRNEISEEYMVSPYLIIFPLYVSIVGVGILNYQSKLIQHAGYNAWISVILTGISIHVILWMIYKILSSNRNDQEIISLNHTLFGKFLGNFVNLAVVLYFVYGAFVKFKVYIEMVQIWLFPRMNILPLTIIIALLIYYAVSGGFRSVTAIGVWTILISLPSVIPQVLLTLPFLHPLNLLPLLNHSATDILLSSKTMVFQYLGLETILLFYPFIKTPAKSQKWAHIIVIFVTFLYLVLLILAFMFLSEGQLRHCIWATLAMISIFEVPLLQSLEYFFVSLWFINIIAGISVYLWVACRGMKTAFRIGQRPSLIVFLIAAVTLNYFIKDHGRIEWISELYGTVGFYFIYAYIPFMFVCVLIRKRLAFHFEERKPA
ncbi:GerAB/ArcD/ProY family transporter [Paenibacillus prosopidis]|uniref:Spore germination protein (Amino acid permease) n=1 Tax=Paenibacillus prosopidis TaxID=630520 RepID=A0A368W5E9_9BACL|nr:GerAB/ArcD/ProY family transporter [Paenibacillus prosopidis]RCW48076.1 spore germination protein (amino acid permease) [Paenibacillus prosopidis]